MGIERTNCGAPISYPDVIKKEAEVGHLTGSKFDSDGSELYSIIKFKDIEPAKALAISEFQKQVKNSNLGRYFTQ